MRKVLYCRCKIQDGRVVYSEMDNKGYFHRFAESEDDVYAVIEQENGNVILCDTTKFKFVESPDSIDLEQNLYEVVKELLINISTDSSVIRHINELLKDLKQ